MAFALRRIAFVGMTVVALTTFPTLAATAQETPAEGSDAPVVTVVDSTETTPEAVPDKPAMPAIAVCTVIRFPWCDW